MLLGPPHREQGGGVQYLSQSHNDAESVTSATMKTLHQSPESCIRREMGDGSLPSIMVARRARLKIRASACLCANMAILCAL